MKFYQIILVTTILVQSFLCTGMDNVLFDDQDLVLHPLQIFDAKNVQLDTLEIWGKPLSHDVPNTFFITIPTELKEYFQTSDNKKKAAQETAQIESAQKAAEEATRIALLKTLKEREETINRLAKENSVLEKQTLENQKKLAAQKKELERREKEIAESKKIVSQKLRAAENTKKNDAPATKKEHLNALKSLKAQHKAREQHQLNTKLGTLCDDIWYGRIKNNKSEGPYFQTRLHVICGAINSRWSYTFYPCKCKIATAKNSYAEIINNIEDFLNQDFICDENCKNYASKSKKDKVPSESSEEVCSSTQSSDMEIVYDADSGPEDTEIRIYK